MIDIVKVFLPAVATFVFGVLITPILTNYLYSKKMWKHKGGKVAMDGKTAEVFNTLHAETETRTPRMGGIVVWASTAVVTLAIWLLSLIVPGDTTIKLDFLSRSQTWIPLFTLIFGGLVGMLNDLLEIDASRRGETGGLSIFKRLGAVALVSLACAVWFYWKLEVDSIGLPGGSELFLGPLFIILFVVVALFIYASGVIDGIDGLSGGVFTTIFAAYGGIAFYQNQIDLAAFCAAVAGGILAFLWFNIPPARFYMTETGTMGLTITLTIVAFMTDRLGEGYGFLVLPVIAFPLVATVISNILQVLSKKFRGKKLFRIAPLHHHFEAIGWPSYKVTMRYWIVSTICAIFGITLALIG